MVLPLIGITVGLGFVGWFFYGLHAAFNDLDRYINKKGGSEYIITRG